MYITVTSLRLRSPLHFFKLSWQAMKIIRQVRKAGAIHYRSTGFWKDHYTLSVWNSMDQLHEFARNGAHQQSMNTKAEIAEYISTYTFESNSVPDWKTAKQLLKQHGRVIRIR